MIEREYDVDREAGEGGEGGEARTTRKRLAKHIHFCLQAEYKESVVMYMYILSSTLGIMS